MLAMWELGQETSRNRESGLSDDVTHATGRIVRDAMTDQHLKATLVSVTSGGKHHLPGAFGANQRHGWRLLART